MNIPLAADFPVAKLILPPGRRPNLFQGRRI
jgi:hypothetical protein